MNKSSMVVRCALREEMCPMLIVNASGDGVDVVDLISTDSFASKDEFKKCIDRSGL